MAKAILKLASGTLAAVKTTRSPFDIAPVAPAATSKFSVRAGWPSAYAMRLGRPLKASAFPEGERSFLSQIRPPLRHRQPQVPILFVTFGMTSASRLLGTTIL
jgi:hypothetical protein